MCPLWRTGQPARDPKLLDAVKVDTKKNAVKVDLSRLYKGIDLPETLSNLTGKRIREFRRQSINSGVSGASTAKGSRSSPAPSRFRLWSPTPYSLASSCLVTTGWLDSRCWLVIIWQARSAPWLGGDVRTESSLPSRQHHVQGVGRRIGLGR